MPSASTGLDMSTTIRQEGPKLEVKPYAAFTVLPSPDAGSGWVSMADTPKKLVSTLVWSAPHTHLSEEAPSLAVRFEMASAYAATISLEALAWVWVRGLENRCISV